MERYSIGQVAQMYGLAPSALRYYDKEGLLPFVERTEGGARLFKEEDLEWLTIIECLKNTGMPIKMIKQFIDWCLEGDPTIERRLAWLTIIECLKNTGMPIKMIKQFIDWCLEGDPTIERRLALIEEHRASVVEQIEQLREHLDLLDYKRWYYEVAQQAGSCDVHRKLSEDEVPERFRARHCACKNAR